ncbi:MAG: crossover junction endodeoxyribonuclease RuvC [Bacteroidales bacterium]
MNKEVTPERVILGIDPGTNVTGYGVIKVTGRKPHLVTLGVIQLPRGEDHFLKLKEIFEKTISLIDTYHPDEFAIEAPFFGKNVQSMLKLGRAQGAAISAALSRSVPVFEYAPRKIKMSITGQGAASKEQVAAMLRSILGFKEEEVVLDATDGLAAALCHYYQAAKPGTEKSYTSWKDFMNKNPRRVK